MENQSILFEPLSAQGQKFENRIVMAPMTRSRAIGSIPNELMKTYYAQRASAGLIIAEGASPSPNGLGYARSPGIFNEAHVAGWRQIAEAVHEKGGRIFLQLMHSGRIGHPANLPEGAEVLGPSAIGAQEQMWTDKEGMQPMPVPREMNLSDIRQAVAEYTRAAELAVEAGLDGVEVHGANGYLPQQFLNPHSNQRSDAYGGNIVNRSRFLLELVDSISSAIGKERTGVRLSPYATFNTQPDYPEINETYEYLAGELDRRGILYLHVVESAAVVREEGRELIRNMRKLFGNLFILNGGYTAEKGAAAIAEGQADLIAFGIPFIANPDLPERFRRQAPLNQANPQFFYTPGEEGYLDYAALDEGIEQMS